MAVYDCWDPFRPLLDTTYLQTGKCAQISAVFDADVGISTVGRSVRVFGGLCYAWRHFVGRFCDCWLLDWMYGGECVHCARTATRELVGLFRDRSRWNCGSVCLTLWVWSAALTGKANRICTHKQNTHTHTSVWYMYICIAMYAIDTTTSIKPDHWIRTVITSEQGWWSTDRGIGVVRMWKQSSCPRIPARLKFSGSTAIGGDDAPWSLDGWAARFRASFGWRSDVDLANAILATQTRVQMIVAITISIMICRVRVCVHVCPHVCIL